MQWYHPWLLLLQLFLASTPTRAGGLLKDQSNDFPPNSSYIRRAYHSSTIVDKFTLIIDGGVIAQTVGSGSDISYLPINYTIAIDMTESWDTSNVSFTLISKSGSHAADNQIMWIPQNQSTIYAFGGASSDSWLLPFGNQSLEAQPVGLYQFDLTSRVVGTWSTIDAPTYQVKGQNKPQPLLRPDKALGTSVDYTGYIVSGVEDGWSQTGNNDLQQDVSIPGIVSFNMTSNVWSNDTIPDGVANTFITGLWNYGPSANGILLSSGSTGIGSQSQSIDNITVYEPISKTWYVQATTGTAPLLRTQPCVISEGGDNGTYEIFLYGGAILANSGDVNSLNSQQTQANIALDEVWVLSVPAFHWFKADYSPEHTRYKHTCNRVGYKQMLSVGGIDPNDAGNAWTPDPASLGLQLFDMTALVWDSGYNVTTAHYTTAQVIKDWYANNPLPKFNDSKLAALFNVTADGTIASPNSSPSSAPTSTTSHTGAIVGGVIGGLVALAAVAALAFLFLRRRNRRGKTLEEQQQQQHLAPDGGVDNQPRWDVSGVHDMYGGETKHGLHEMNGNGGGGGYESTKQGYEDRDGVPELNGNGNGGGLRPAELQEGTAGGKHFSHELSGEGVSEMGDR